VANLIGQQLGQYEITALLGKGGMATVYRARQVSINRDVAIKVIRPDLAETSEFLNRFRREAQLVAQLSHPFILKVFDYGEHDDNFYLIMELLPGGSLADVLLRETLPLPSVNRVLEQVSSALDYAHQKGIIHRDLKPQNVLLDGQGNALLTDFGVAKILSDSNAMTRTGLAMGTPAYMAPEQWQAMPLDARTDVYALGIMTYEMLCGTLPFKADTPYSMMHMHINEMPQPIRTLRADLPAGLERVIRTAISKDAKQRYASAGEFATAFKSAAVESSPAVMNTMIDQVDDDTLKVAAPKGTLPPPQSTPAQTPAQAARTAPREQRPDSGAYTASVDSGRVPMGSAPNATVASRPNSSRALMVSMVATVVVLLLITGGIAILLAGRNTITPTPANTALAQVDTPTSLPDGATATPAVSSAAVSTDVPIQPDASDVQPTVAQVASTAVAAVPTTAVAQVASPQPPTLIPTNTETPTPDVPTSTPTVAITPTVTAFITNLDGGHAASKAGTWVIGDTGLVGDSQSGDSFYLTDTSASDFTYEADFMITDGSDKSSAGLIFRSAADPLDGSYVTRVSTANGGQINLFKFFGGKKNVGYKQIGLRGVRIEKNVTYHISVEAKGSIFTVYLDGEQMFKVSDTAYTDGYFGLDIYQATVNYETLTYQTTS
jgi:serine/threonine protein kinase